MSQGLCYFFENLKVVEYIINILARLMVAIIDESFQLRTEQKFIYQVEK